MREWNESAPQATQIRVPNAEKLRQVVPGKATEWMSTIQ
jgi:hypothetical protein